jgi:hypothetical protein
MKKQPLLVFHYAIILSLAPPPQVKKKPKGWLSKLMVFSPIGICPTLKEFFLSAYKIKNVPSIGMFQITKYSFDNPIQGAKIGHKLSTMANHICKVWLSISNYKYIRFANSPWELKALHIVELDVTGKAPW